MVELAVISDTHVPSRADRVPGFVRERLASADHAVHAGDFDSADAFERIVGMAGGDLTAVKGNTDPRTLGVPEVATLEAGGLRFVVTHGTGRPGDWADRVARTVVEEDADVGIAGHTHRVTDERHRGVRLLNPGSATGAAPATRASMLVLSVEDGDLDVERVTR